MTNSIGDELDYYRFHIVEETLLSLGSQTSSDCCRDYETTFDPQSAFLYYILVSSAVGLEIHVLNIYSVIKELVFFKTHVSVVCARNCKLKCSR